MNELFHSATVKLTAWYLLIIMLISICFSGVIYSVSSQEFERGLPPIIFNGLGGRVDANTLETIRVQRAAEGRDALLRNLTLVNLVTLGLGGLASYLLARRTLEPIAEASEAQSRFISDASHELRTPLAIMQSEIDVKLRSEKLTKAELRQLAESNLEEVNKLRSLSDRLLQLSNGHDIELTAVSVEDAIIQAATPYFAIAEAKNIEIVNEIQPISVYANHESLCDVVAILIDNALKYSPNRTRIVLRSYVRNRVGHIEVQDHGQGIKPIDLPYIFDRFYRADISRSKLNVDGHGLGLSIAKQVVERMRGSLTVVSKSKRGSTFTVKLNLAKSSD